MPESTERSKAEKLWNLAAAAIFAALVFDLWTDPRRP
jgi:hypothetical protein